MRLILASQSPRRRELMALVTPDFACKTAPVNEAAVDAALPADMPPAGRVLALAEAKAGAVFATSLGRAVVGCDTVVELAGRALGKPADEAEARAMLQSLAGRRHLVHTGIYIQAPGKKGEHVETTAVDFAEIPEEELDLYIKTSEPYDKAGGYGVQGWAARFIPRIEGCYYNVMGLPVSALWRLLHGMELL